MLIMGLSVGAVMGIWLAMVGFRTGSVAVTSRIRLKGMAAKVGSWVCLVLGLLCLLGAIGLLIGLLRI